MQQQILVEQENELGEVRSTGSVDLPEVSAEREDDAIGNKIQREHIQEQINQMYEEPFQYISEEDQLAQAQQHISDECESNGSEKRVKSSISLDSQYELITSQRLQQECKYMQNRFNEMTNIIQSKQIEQQSLQRYQKEINEQCDKLSHQISVNNELLHLLHKQLSQPYGSIVKINKQAYQITNLLLQNDKTEDILLQQIVNSNTLIHILNLQTVRLRREVRKNEDYIPLNEEQQIALYAKCKRMRRQIDEKNQKYKNQQQDIRELDQKINQLRQKIIHIQRIDLYKNQKHEKMERELSKRFKQLCRKRQFEEKRCNLLMHQLQQNSYNLARSILQQRKYNNDISIKIKHVMSKNTMIEQDNQRLISNYNKLKNDKVSKEKTPKKIEKLEEVLSKQINIPTAFTRYEEHIKIIKNPLINNISLKNHEIKMNAEENQIQAMTPKSIENTNEADEQVKLEQSSTAHYLKNNFKFRLPSKALNHIIRPANLSVQMTMRQQTEKRVCKKNMIYKLSFTQRLKRIQLLENEDRMFSLKSKQNQGKRSKSTIKRMGEKQNPQTYNLLEVGTVPQRMVNLLKSFQDKSEANRQKRLNESNDPFVASDTGSDSSFLCESGVRFSSTNLKKRIYSKQKKIPEEYMRALQEKGRRILELDEESQA